MIVEGLMTTVSESGRQNVAPMGPVVTGDFEALLLRPFQGSTTCDNLMATRCGVFHVVDRVGIIAEAAVRRLECLPETHPAKVVDGWVLRDCCRWFELEIMDIDARQPRTEMRARIVHTENVRPHFGFNRARHAVIEAAILATRTHLLPAAEIVATFAQLASAIEKTGGEEEHRAFQLLSQHVGFCAAKGV